ncbi:glucosaminidase domain-containing protein [Anaerovibrio slackiae]|uniref:glucosaminidase domain-containing protein n=1 Tax=Anaerovibrio slackiae TaxID=2652309 RepID=UPI003F17E172
MRGKRLLSVVACSLSFLFFAGIGSADATTGRQAGQPEDVRVSGRTVVNTDRHKSLRSGDVMDRNEVADEGVEAMSAAEKPEKALSLQERIQRILHPEDFMPPKPAVVAMSNDDNMIMGGAVATQEQCVRYLLRNNPYPKLNVSPQELVAYYYEEGSRTGIRPDIAFAQALKETGYFRYGGTVVPAQNNYCGLGTTSATVRGAYFATPRLGVKAHIQHLLAYASTEKPDDNIVDPRYDLVRNSYGEKTLTRWQDLNGRWAVPGVGYGQSILNDYYKGIINS